MNVFKRKVVRNYLAVRRRDLSANPDYHKVQQDKLRALLKDAAAHSVFQRERLTDIERYSDIPPTDKVSMMDRFLDTLNERLLQEFGLTKEEVWDFVQKANTKSSPWLRRDQVRLARTSGTTGQPGFFLGVVEESLIQRSVSLARSGMYRMPLLSLVPGIRKQRIAMVGGGRENSLSGSSFINNLAREKLSRLLDMRSFSSYQEPEVLVSQLNDFKPHQITAYPPYLVKLAEIKLQGYEFHFAPKRLALGADLLSKQDRDKLVEAFPGARIRNHYGSIETSPIALSCSYGTLHVNMDFVIVEAVDDSDGPVEPGQWSDAILVTDLTRRLHPVIRYRMGDSIRILTEGCPCGSRLPAMEIRSRRIRKLYFDDNLGQEQEILSTELMDKVMYDTVLPWCRMEYHQRNRFRFVFNVPAFPLPSMLCTVEDIRRHLTPIFDDFMRKHGCTDSVSFEICTIPEPPPKADNLKRREVEVRVASKH
ncbi:MAG: hypothetical protein KTR24_13120 [Saprospiraceae bacterium]|nr:hypothetical protein [Saprospiraceae bacterium]